MVNRFYTRQPYDLGLYVPPIDAIEQNLKLAQQQFDTNFAVSNMIKNNYIPSLPQDRAKANELQQGWEKQIDEIVKKYNGNYAAAGKDLRVLLGSVQKQLNPGGEGYAIKSNYGNYQKWLEEHQKRVADGKVLGEDLNLANGYYMKQYKGIGTIDPVTGAYNQFNPEILSDFQDREKIVQDVYKGFKPETYKVGKTVFSNGLQHYIEEEQTGITAERLAPSFATALTSDPKLNTYLTQKARFLGIPEDKVAESQLMYAQQRAHDLSYMNKSSIDKAERDPLYLLREKARLDKEAKQEEMQGLRWQWDATTGNPVARELKVNATNWRTLAAEGNSTAGIPTAQSGNALMSPTGYGRSSDIPGKPQASTKSLGEVLRDPKFLERSGIVPQLANQVYADVSKQYAGRSQKEIEQRFWETYTPAHNNATIGQSRSWAIDPAIQGNISKALLPGVMSGNLTMYKMGDNRVATSEGLGLKESDFVTSDGKLKIGVAFSSYVRPGMGTPKAGYTINIPGKGQYVVVDQDAQRQQASQVLESSFSPIFVGGMTTGNPLWVSDGKQNVQAVPRWEFDSNNGYQGDIRFYNKADGTLVLHQGRPLNYNDVIESSDSAFSTALPYVDPKKSIQGSFYGYATN